jgi:multiple sugar transport system permease protein
MTVATAPPVTSAPHRQQRRRPRPAARLQVASQAFMVVVCVLWLLPLLFALYVALRPYSETAKYGYVSLPRHLTLANFRDAWTQSGMGRFFWNSVMVTVPSVILVLGLASAAAYVVSRTRSSVNIAMLILFTASNLLPPQVIITPLYRLYLAIPVPTALSGSGLLYNSIASAWTRYRKLTLPLCRPALAALATLLTTWIYNDFFWAITLMSSGDKRPITSALANLQGQYVSNQNLIAAAAMLTAIPTLVVYICLQKQFVAGLSLGSSKG